ncbi:ficolin-2-like [Physella acuta]|uniref:ficolin-2-like n=1 Tax=Physella acuta TaxID=109671 RepID=UPI0027DB0FB4|nr:ficolin-2-like [Physella acuta]
MFTNLSFVLCLLWMFAVICAQDSSVDANNTRSKRSSVEELFTLNSCKGCASTVPRPVVTLSSGLEVVCDTETDGGGWTVIQRRFNGQTDFYRGWWEYKYGFGELDGGEFWLGNENIHRLTIKKRHELRVDLKYNNTDYYAKYSRFRLFGEPEGYALQVSGFSGNAGDSFEYHKNSMFSTFDKDRDSSSENCAYRFHGAWWYNDCQRSNLNGVWGSKEFGMGVNWLQTTGRYASATFTEMKVRPI